MLNLSLGGGGGARKQNFRGVRIPLQSNDNHELLPGVSLFLKVEGGLKNVDGRVSSADCCGEVVASGGRFAILAQEYCAKSTDS